MSSQPVVPSLTLEQQAAWVEEQGFDTLLFCRDAWALRHRFTHELTGETIRARCDSWHCLYCGPRKVETWRQLIKLVGASLFVTFTQVGQTVEEASRVLTTVMQYLRRGSRGKGPHRVGARPAYPVEWFAVLERHSNFEQVGFHWHVLVRGVEYIEHAHLREALRSATKGRSYIVHVAQVQSGAVGYVTKYLTKDLTVGEQGVTLRTRKVSKPVLEAVKSEQVTRLVKGSDGAMQEVTEDRPYLFASRLDEQGNTRRELVEEPVERTSKARRIRYSRQFFPMSTKEMRWRVFSGLGLEEEPGVVEGELVGEEQGQRVNGLEKDEMVARAEHENKSGEEEMGRTGAGVAGRSRWVLFESEPYSPDVKAYEQRKRKALVEAVEEIRAGRRLSRRVVNVWSYQQGEQQDVRKWASGDSRQGRSEEVRL